ncbi:MAG TPA: cyclic nucleotide-binding domain-containing protein [Alphaproteobacteria bacterium]|nr:cyclic nucleotide-binding domain-containing protein [Alphaproteobacteria bacterium]
MLDGAPQSSKLQVFIARDDEERRRIYRFRYRVKVEELDAKPPHANHRTKEIVDPLDKSAMQIYVAQSAGHDLVASARINVRLAENNLSDITSLEGFGPFREFGVQSLSLSGQLVISPKWASSQAASLALSAIYKLARQNDSLFDFTQCAPALLPLYQRLGYRQFRENFMDDALGYQVPLVMVTQDFQHLAKVKSPLTQIARGMNNPPETGNWFSRAYPDYAHAPVEAAMADDEFWHFLARKLNQTPNAGIPLLEGLGYQEAMAFIRAGSVLNCRKNMPIVKAGQMGKEMFVILSGAVKVLAGPDKAEVARLNRGDIFGELAYLSEVPRTADVVTTEDTELLVLSQDIVRRIMDKMPAIAARVLFNLSLILCTRVGQSTRDLVTATSPQQPAGILPGLVPLTSKP